MTRLCFLSAQQMLDGYRSKTISPLQVIKDVLSRIREVNETYNCMCFVVDEKILISQAHQSEERWKRGQPMGKLDGIPITIKDLLYVPDMPTLNGSMLPVDKKHPMTSPCVASVMQAGAIIVGKTTTSDYGWKAVTESKRTGITRNPYDSSKITGGSSGGSATAVALGIGPISIGTDAGGSLRIPAGFCGVVTIKSTIGIVPHAPVSVFGSLSTAGPFARDVRDMSLLLEVIAQTNLEDWLSVYPGRRDTLMANPYTRLCEEGGDLRGVRIAVSLNLGGYVRYVHPDISAAVAQAAKVLEGLGAAITFVDQTGELDFSQYDIFKTYKVLWSGAASQLLHTNMKKHKMSEEEIKKILDDGMFALAKLANNYSSREAMAAEHTRATMGAMMNKFHQKYDVLLTPNCAIPPFDTTLEVPPNITEVATGPGLEGWDADFDINRFYTWTPFSYVFNMTKQPALTLPCGKFSQGKETPIAMQVIGPMFAEDKVIRVSNVYQRVTHHHERVADQMN